MKKAIAIILSALLVCTMFASCGKVPEKEETSTAPETQSESLTNEETSSETETSEPTTQETKAQTKPPVEKTTKAPSRNNAKKETTTAAPKRNEPVTSSEARSIADKYIKSHEDASNLAFEKCERHTDGKYWMFVNESGKPYWVVEYKVKDELCDYVFICIDEATGKVLYRGSYGD